DYPDPQDWFSTNFGCNGGNNRFNYCNPAFDALVERADASMDSSERLDLYAQAQQILVEDAAGLWLLNPDRLVLVKPYVQDLTFTGQDDYPGDQLLDTSWIAGH